MQRPTPRGLTWSVIGAVGLLALLAVAESATSNYALAIALTVGILAAFMLVASAGMVGFTLAMRRTVMRRGAAPGVAVAVTVGAGVLAFIGAWLPFVVWWPFAQLCRPFPRLRYVGPAVGVVLVVAAFGYWADRSTVHPLFVNDTGRTVELSGCTDDPAELDPGAQTSGPYVGVGARECTVYEDQSDKAAGCLLLPQDLSSNTVVHIRFLVPPPYGQDYCPD